MHDHHRFTIFLIKQTTKLLISYAKVLNVWSVCKYTDFKTSILISSVSIQFSMQFSMQFTFIIWTFTSTGPRRSTHWKINSNSYLKKLFSYSKIILLVFIAFHCATFFFIDQGSYHFILSFRRVSHQGPHLFIPGLNSMLQKSLNTQIRKKITWIYDVERVD